jgi:hypothetical protein
MFLNMYIEKALLLISLILSSMSVEVLLAKKLLVYGAMGEGGESS